MRRTSKFATLDRIMMDLLNVNGVNLRSLDRKNILLGKNGCGKSYLLRILEQGTRGKPGYGVVKYLSPERGGELQYNPGIEQNIIQAQDWLATTRRANQASQFRLQSAAQFRQLELLTLREIERDPEKRRDPTVTFDSTIERINRLLDRVHIVRSDQVFSVQDRATRKVITGNEISSGESELITLGIECLMFERECKAGKTNLLLMDEPDVHLHPDLQARLARFLDELMSTGSAIIVIATHSTALLGAMAGDRYTHVAFMRKGETDITFSEPSQAQRKVLPVFGAHPLSNIFNEAPVLLLEGEDDERIWQQVVRSSVGRVKVYPCSVDGVANLTEFEQEVTRIIEAVYDNGVAYSLRDRDSGPEEIPDVGPVRRMRLSCRAAENLILTDEVLECLGIKWADLKTRIENWLETNASHLHFAKMKAFVDGGYNLITADVKDIRYDLLGLIGTNKPWEVMVGQAIASLPESKGNYGPTSLAKFLGAAVCQHILRINVSS